MSLGSQIRHYREQLGLTLEQLSERSDVDVGTISALEVRDSERSKYAAAIAKGLGVDLDVLLGPPAHSARGAAVDLLNQRSVAYAGEPGANYRAWPFRQLTPADIGQLDAVQLAQLEGFALGLLTSRKRQLAGGQ